VGNVSAGVLLLLYFASGAAALILEVTWSRLLVLQFGSTTGATSTVLAAFMGGLAGGSLLGGRFAERQAPRDALRAYSAVETAVAASALILPLAIQAARPLLAITYGDGEQPVSFAVARFLVSVWALAVPTLAMGASYPLAARALSGSTDNVGLASRLYAANTFGAAAGALAAGFWLVPALGMRGTTAVAAALSLTSGVAAWRLASRTAPVSVKKATRSTASTTDGVDRVWLGLAATTASGFVALGSEVAWTRVLALLVGPTTYAFSGLLATFLVCLSIGAVIGRRLGRTPHATLWLGLTSLGAAVATASAISNTSRVLIWIAQAGGAPGTFSAAIVQQLAVTAILVGPLAIACGASFPLALAVMTRHGLTPIHLGRAYAMNTAGSVAGALIIGFIAIPVLGLHATLRLCGLASVLMAVVIFAAAPASALVRATGVAVALLAGIGAIRADPWNPALLSSGVYRFASSSQADDVESTLAAGEVLFYKEDMAATVAVRRLGGATSLVIDGKPDASTAGDMLTQKLLAHVPLLVHQSPARVGIIGLGSGVTAGAALVHPIARLDVVEISPAVVEAAALFRAHNRDPLADSRARLILADGRSHIRLGAGRYDVIISEPSNPWMAGIAALFTREFLIDVRDRLTEDGIFCQWAHTYDMSDSDLRSIVGTFTGVFPHSALWLVGEADVLLLGSRSAIDLDHPSVERALQRAGVRHDLRQVGVSGPEDLLGLHVAGTTALRAYAAGAAQQSDDRMSLEFSAPRSLVTRAGGANVASLLALRAQPLRLTGEGWLTRGRMLLQAEAYDLALLSLQRAADARPFDQDGLALLGRAAAGARRSAEVIPHLERLLARDPACVAVRVALARALMQAGNADRAVAVLKQAGSSDDPRVVAALAAIFVDVGDVERLAVAVAGLREAAPDGPDTAYFAASLAFLQGNASAALVQAQSVVSSDRADARTHNLIGAALATLGRLEDARAAFARAAAVDPTDSSVHVNAGQLELDAGRKDRAKHHFATALAIDHANVAAREGLAAVRAQW
jgi:spermidine synthase